MLFGMCLFILVTLLSTNASTQGLVIVEDVTVKCYSCDVGGYVGLLWVLSTWCRWGVFECDVSNFPGVLGWLASKAPSRLFSEFLSLTLRHVVTLNTVGILQYKPIQFRNLTNQHAQINNYIVKMPAVIARGCGAFPSSQRGVFG